MNGKEVYGMLNGLEERLIEETLQAEPVRRHIPFKMALSAAACVCLCVAVLAVAVITGPKQQTPSENGEAQRSPPSKAKRRAKSKTRRRSAGWSSTTFPMCRKQTPANAISTLRCTLNRYGIGIKLPHILGKT